MYNTLEELIFLVKSKAAYKKSCDVEGLKQLRESKKSTDITSQTNQTNRKGKEEDEIGEETVESTNHLVM